MLKKHAIFSLVSLLILGAVPLSAHAKQTTTPITAQDGVVAIVNDEIILKSELNEAVALLRQATNAKVSTQTLANRALDMLIVRKIQLGIIKRAGITTNETVINQELLKIARAEGFDNLTSFAKHLEGQKKGSYSTLRNELIEEASLAALWQHEIGNRVKVSSQEIDAFLASPEGKNLNQDEYRTVHVRVPYIDDPARLTAEQKQQAFTVATRLSEILKTTSNLTQAMKQAQGNYPNQLQGATTDFTPTKALPRELTNIITSLNVGDVSKPIITDAGVDVVMLADKRTGGQVLLPEWHTSHILIKVDAVQSDAIAKQKISDIYTALQRGANFDDLAATYSEDVGSATQKGSLNWVSEGQMVPEFEAMMKKTEKGDFSTPFTTQFGYHILKVNDTRQRDVTDTYRRTKAEEILLSRLAPQAQEDWLQELRSNSYIKIIGQ